MSDASGSGHCRVLRLNTYLPKRTINAAIIEAVQRLQYSRVTEKQTSEFVTGEDMLVVLPTGSGKSLSYAALPYVFEISKSHLQPPCGVF